MLGFLLLGLLLLAAGTFSGVIIEPINALIRQMKIAETGDFEAAGMADTAERRDEVGNLHREFRFFLKRIQELIYDNYEKQMLLKDTKYKMLQAQINPHFLYNTLNTVNWMIQLEKNREASHMIVQLGELLRASFVSDPYGSAREELDMLKNYIAIQEYRYRDRVHFEIEESGALEDFVVPRMILQPLVENALNYGADRMSERCEIRVTAEAEAETLFLCVSDNGPGVPEEKLRAMQRFMVRPEGHGIGLRNINERLRITYTEYCFQIHSECGKGTRIELRLPRIERAVQPKGE